VAVDCIAPSVGNWHCVTKIEMIGGITFNLIFALIVGARWAVRNEKAVVGNRDVFGLYVYGWLCKKQ
jgi:hypothetical protein